MAVKEKKQYLIEDTIIVDEIYSIIDKNLESRISNLKKCIEKFIHERQAQLYDYAPVDRIYFKKQDETNFFNSVNTNFTEVHKIMNDLYYWKKDELQACKDPFSITMFMCIRWIAIHKKNDPKLLELAYMYLAFSGKFYASCHYKWFKQYVPKREVMDYVINYMLSEKFDLIKTKSVFGAVRNLASTWMNTYQTELVSSGLTDERIVYMIHQLHSRIYAFLRNIAKPYYEAYEKKLYINAESDNYSENNFRIANSNSTIIASITEKTVNYMSTTQVNMSLCQAVSQGAVNAFEIKAIFENIISDNSHLSELRYVINVLLVDFAKSHPDLKSVEDLTGVEFIANSMAMKPNTKDKDIIQMKNLVLSWLMTSDRYIRTKTPATQNNYYKAMLGYIALTVNSVSKMDY